MTLDKQLRQEMQLFLSRRHDYSLRKLSFCTALLGLGTISVTLETSPGLSVPGLLYIVPLIAVAFDLYIVAEDHRAKRIGVFVQRPRRRLSDFERFVTQSKNLTAPWTFAAVTVIMLGLAAAVLWGTRPHLGLFAAWIILVVATDAALIFQVHQARARLLIVLGCPA